MLLIDQILRADKADLQKLKQEIRKELLELTVLDVSNIKDYVEEAWDKKRYDYPNCAPPWPTFWLEYKDVAGFYVKAEVLETDEWCLHVTYVCREKSQGYISGTLKLMVGADGKYNGYRKRFENSKVRIAKVLHPESIFLSPQMPTCTLPSGAKVTLETAEKNFRATEFSLMKKKGHETLEDLGACLVDKKNLDNLLADLTDQLAFATFLDEGIHILCMALSFCHCKNVKQEAAWATEKRKDKERRDGIPSFKFHRLSITRAESQRGESQSDGSTRAMHIRRGHFKTFTPEKPLFGTRVGTYWWEANVVGDVKRGVVEKLYQI